MTTGCGKAGGDLRRAEFFFTLLHICIGYSFRLDSPTAPFLMTLTMNITRLINRLRNINGRRLARATGIVLATAIVITAICIIGEYAPGVLIALLVAFFILAVYFLLGMLEE